MIESNRVTNTAEIHRLGRRWCQIVREGLDKLLTEGVSSQANARSENAF
jgi:hypothetical protein